MTATTYNAKTVYTFPLKDIEIDEDWNCRGHIDPTTLLELAGSIENEGQQAPVHVIPNPGGDKPFRLIAGYRRYAAMRLLKRTEIDCLVKLGLNEADARIWNLTENLQRENLNIKQEAHAIGHLRFLPQEVIEKRIGKSRGWVQNRLYLLRLPDSLQDEAVMGWLTSAEIRKCAMLETDEARIAYVKLLKDAKLQNKKVEVNVEKVTARAGKALRSATEIEEMIDLIHETFGHSLTTRALAWAAGNISAKELHESIKETADKEGKVYFLPEWM